MVSNKARRRSHVGGFSFGAESFGSALFFYALWQPNHSGRRTVMLTGGYQNHGARTGAADWNRRSLMFQELIDDYRRQAEQYIADAIKLESGDADQSSPAAASKRGLAAMLVGLADAYEELDR